MPRVTSAQFQKQFGTYARLAQREAITITSHGKDSLVVLSVDDYARLKSFDTREAYSVSALPKDIHDALLTAQPPQWTQQFDSELGE